MSKTHYIDYDHQAWIHCKGQTHTGLAVENYNPVR